MQKNRDEQDIEPFAYRINPFCKAIGIGRTAAYDLMKKGQLRTILVAGRRLVPRAEVDRLLAGSTTIAN